MEPNALRHSLARCKTIDRQLDARIAVRLYRDNEHGDDRDNTYARLPSPSDECAEGTYWISSFSGLSLRTAPAFTGDRLLKQIAMTALIHLKGQSNE